MQMWSFITDSESLFILSNRENTSNAIYKILLKEWKFDYSVAMMEFESPQS